MTDSAKKKKRLPPILISRKTHWACFLAPLFFILIYIYYSITNNEINPYFIIFIILFFISQYFLHYHGKRIFITDKKIYAYSRKKKILSLPLVGGFTHISYKQSKLGKILNYGTLHILTIENTLFTYQYLQDCSLMYDKILEQHVIEVKKIDPDYELEAPSTAKETEKNTELDVIKEEKDEEAEEVITRPVKESNE